ncbi:MAG: hypothetical protein LC772_00255 [Chloroflexi bacterium]|nr:hypothetical protein [Chloroflexota bacterium]
MSRSEGEILDHGVTQAYNWFIACAGSFAPGGPVIHQLTAGILIAAALAAAAAVAPVAFGVSARAAPSPPARPVSFSNQVHPILQRHCQGCHQPANSGGGLSLTTYAGLLKGGDGGPAFKAGDPAAEESTASVSLGCRCNPPLDRTGGKGRHPCAAGQYRQQPSSCLSRGPHYFSALLLT